MDGGVRTSSESPRTISAAATEAVRRSVAAMVKMVVAFDFIDVLHELLLLPVRRALSDAEKDEETGAFFKRLLLRSTPWLAIVNV
jgi:hypothetical protein